MLRGTRFPLKNKILVRGILLHRKPGCAAPPDRVRILSNLDELAKHLGAVGHPTRLRILLALCDGEASPRAIARRLELTLGVVAHHVRGLARAGLIRQTRTRPVRGAEEHFYVLSSDALDLLDDLREALLAGIDDDLTLKDTSLRRSLDQMRGGRKRAT